MKLKRREQLKSACGRRMTEGSSEGHGADEALLHLFSLDSQVSRPFSHACEQYEARDEPGERRYT